MAVTQPSAPASAPERRERFTFTPRQYERVADVALATLTLIIFTGAAVRLTGSGLGCPEWPTCDGGRVLPELRAHTMIEFGNRLVTGVVGLPCLLAAVGAFRLRPFRPELRLPAGLMLAGVGAQAVLGGLTVRLDLSWEVVIAHYLLSILLLIAGAVLVWRVRRGADATRPEHSRGLVLGARALAAWGGYVIVAGTFATAAGPHAGGAGTNDYVERLDALGADTLRSLIHLHGHSATVMGFAAVALWLYARRRGAGGLLVKALTASCILLALQGIVGLVQYHSELPAALVWVHASLAALLWLALVFTVLAAGRVQSRRP